MAVTLVTAARNAACNAIVDLLDTGTTDATGDIAFSTSAPVTLCVNNLANPAFGNSSTGVATAGTIAQGTVSGSSNPSTIALALFRNRDNTEQFRCAVATSGSDINLTNVSVNNGDTIDISSLTYTVPAT
jgi:hypothetical protein